MLVKCKSALLLSDVQSFALAFKAIADEAEVKLSVEDSWNTRYRVSQDVVILGSKYLEFLNEAYYNNAVLILKADESPYQYIQKGITRFIFDYHNKYELFTSLFKTEAVTVHSSNLGLQEILKDCGVWNFQFGDYDFQFDKNRFIYRGKPLYLADSQKRYLADWLLCGHKDNSKRMVLCTMRKKFGKDFLADIDRYGQLIGGKDE